MAGVVREGLLQQSALDEVTLFPWKNSFSCLEP